MARPGRPAMPKPNLHPLVDSFLDMLTTEKGAAMNTRQAYWRDLADFSLYLRGKVKKEIVDTTEKEIKSYLEDLGNKIHVKGRTATRSRAAPLRAAFQPCDSFTVIWSRKISVRTIQPLRSTARNRFAPCRRF